MFPAGREDSEPHKDRGGPKPTQSGAIGAEIARIAGRQLGVIGLEQLYELGLSYRDVRGMRTRSYLIPVHRGVYIVGHSAVVARAYLIAALLASPPDAFLSHRTAAAARGLRSIQTRKIDITVPSGRVHQRPGLVVHRTATPPHPSELKVLDGLRVSSVPRMLVELAPTETRQELGRLIAVSIRKRLLDLVIMEETLERHHRRPGIGNLTAALAGYRPQPERDSGFEYAFDEWLAGQPELPASVGSVILDGRWQLDYYWPQLRFALELDGRSYHTAVEDFDRDRSKDIYLKRHGIDHIRITDTRFREDKPGILDDLRHFLKVRRGA